MADLSAVPVSDYGALLSSYGNAQANQQASYAEAAKERADIPLIQAQTQGAQIQNARSAWQLKGLQALLGGSNSSAPGAPASGAGSPVAGGGENAAPGASNAATGGSPFLNADGSPNTSAISGAVDDRFTQKPYVPSAQVAKLNAASAAYGAPEFGAAAMAQEKAGYDAQMQGRSIAANNLYDQAVDVHNAAKDGHAVETLRLYNSGAADAIVQRGKDMGWTDDQVNQHAADLADALGGAAYRHTGREVVDKNGVAFDKQTGQPVLGAKQAPMSASEQANLSAALDKPVDQPDGQGGTTQVPQWKASGYASKAQAMAAETANPGISQQGLPHQATAAAAANAKNDPAAAHSAAMGQDPEAPTVYGVPNKAFTDPDYKAPVVSAPRGTTLNPGQQDLQKTLVKSSSDLLDSAGEVTAASSRALQYFGAAKTILDAPNGQAITGLPGAIVADLNKLGFNLQNGNDRVEAVKYLTNGALQGLKQTYGSKPAQFDVKVNLEQAFPDVKSQGLGALKNLVDYNVRAANYDLASAKRVNGYLNANMDPRKFNQWNEQYASRAANINQAPPAGANAITHVTDAAGYAAIKPGQQYISPDGMTRTKPAAAQPAAQ